MAVIGDQDVASGLFHRDCSVVTIVATGQTFMGFFEIPEVVTGFPPLNVMAGDVAGRPTLQYTVELAPEMGNGMVVDIDGKRWEVRNKRLIEDGKIAVVDLKKP